MGGAAYARENIQSVVIVVLVIVVIVAAGVIWTNSRTTRRETAATKLGMAQIAYNLENYNEAKDSLLSLTRSFPKADAAKTGYYLLGHLYFALGQMDSAKIFWQKYINSDLEDNDMTAASRAGIAAIMSNNRDFTGAAEEFEKIYEKYPEYFDRGNVLWLAAVNYQAADEKEKAIELMEKFLDKYGDSPKAMNTRLILAELRARMQ